MPTLRGRVVQWVYTVLDRQWLEAGSEWCFHWEGSKSGRGHVLLSHSTPLGPPVGNGQTWLCLPLVLSRFLCSCLVVHRCSPHPVRKDHRMVWENLLDRMEHVLHTYWRLANSNPPLTFCLNYLCMHASDGPDWVFFSLHSGGFSSGIACSKSHITSSSVWRPCCLVKDSAQK